MVKKEILSVLEQFKKFIEEKKIHVDRMILFGSWAKGNPREGSDIDVVVISKDFGSKDYWARIDILAQAVYKVLAPIEAVAMTPQEWDSKESVIYEFAKDGLVI